jgi:ADP-ribose pyrophosphatase
MLATMRREYPEQPSIGVGVVIIKDNRVLVVQRGKEPAAGTWAFPGGRLELGETLAEAAVREAREETGLTVEPGEVIAVMDLIDTDEGGHVRFHYVLIDLLAQAVGGTLRPGDDSVAVRWIGLEDVDGLPMAPRMADAVRRVLGDTDTDHD